MNDLMEFITQGADTLESPAVMCGLIVFCMIYDGICSIVSSLIKGVRR